MPTCRPRWATSDGPAATPPGLKCKSTLGHLLSGLNFKCPWTWTNKNASHERYLSKDSARLSHTFRALPQWLVDFFIVGRSTMQFRFACVILAVVAAGIAEGTSESNPKEHRQFKRAVSGLSHSGKLLQCSGLAMSFVSATTCTVELETIQHYPSSLKFYSARYDGNNTIHPALLVQAFRLWRHILHSGLFIFSS